jgi:hypothetical protein
LGSQAGANGSKSRQIVSIFERQTHVILAIVSNGFAHADGFFVEFNGSVLPHFGLSYLER